MGGSLAGEFFRLLPSFRGKQRLGRLFLGRQLAAGSQLEIRGKFGTNYLLPNASEEIGFEILLNGIYEEETIAFIARRIGANARILDIGANIGAIGIPLCKLRPDIECICIEASSWIFDFLKRNIEINGVRCTPINLAVSDLGDRIMDFYSPREKYGKGSFAPVFTGQATRVEAITLDKLASLYEGVDFIKLDVEGFEYEVFHGGKCLLQQSKAPEILFEFVDWAEQAAGREPGSAQRLLMEYGYQLHPLRKAFVRKQLDVPLSEGSCMIFATKQQQ